MKCEYEMCVCDDGEPDPVTVEFFSCGVEPMPILPEGCALYQAHTTHREDFEHLFFFAAPSMADDDALFVAVLSALGHKYGRKHPDLLRIEEVTDFYYADLD